VSEVCAGHPWISSLNSLERVALQRCFDKRPAPAPLRQERFIIRHKDAENQPSSINQISLYASQNLLPHLSWGPCCRNFLRIRTARPGDCPHPQTAQVPHGAQVTCAEGYDTTALWKVSSVLGCTVPGFIGL